MARGVHLSQGQLVVVAVVEDVHEVAVERVDILQLGEVGQDEAELLAEVALRELDLPHVESPDAADLVLFVHYGGRLPLRLGEDDVDELLGRGHDGDLLEVVLHHLEDGPQHVRVLSKQQSSNKSQLS